MRLIHADSEVYLKELKDNSVDSVVCDPPYGINFIGNKWDKGLPNKTIWRECLRVLRPGGYILAFSSARLYHHLASDLEQVGFITHPMIGWIYGQGFPKGTDLAKELDRKKGINYPDQEFRNYLREAIRKRGYTLSELEKKLRLNGMFSHYVGTSQPQFPTPKIWQALKKILHFDNRYDETINSNRLSERSDSGHELIFLDGVHSKEFVKYTPQTQLATQWSGFRYGLQCLKPALEPIYMGQKPFEKNMVENIKKWGVGALNIDDCRVLPEQNNNKLYNSDGRYPSNVIHNGSEEVMQSLYDVPFFYCAKPTPQERGENNCHPTVKPIKLMRYLTRLVTPKRGMCLDPFMGSGTTAIAAHLNRLNFIGIEKAKKYFDLAKKRITKAQTTCGCESLYEGDVNEKHVG